MRTGLNQRQRQQLLQGLNARRVASRTNSGKTLSYLEAWDVKAHLNRIFGFLNWSADVLSAELAFEEQVKSSSSERMNWSVGYRVTLRLTMHMEGGNVTYTEAAVGFSKQPDRGEAHDMAIKTAESDALKRAAINLGTQFGLSLYNNGSLADVVQTTLDDESVSRRETDAGAPAPAETDASDAPKSRKRKPAEPVAAPEPAVEPEPAIDADTPPIDVSSLEVVEPAAEPSPSSDDAEQWYERIVAAFRTEGSNAERAHAIVQVRQEIVAAGCISLKRGDTTLGVLADRALAAITNPQKD